MLLLFFVSSASIEFCKYYTKQYDENVQKCCAESNSSSDVWICENTEECVTGGKCRVKGIGAKDEEIVFTAWFVYTTIQIILFVYIYRIFGNGNFHSGIIWSFIMFIFLSLSFFSMILSIVLAVKRNTGFLTILFVVFVVDSIFLGLKGKFLSSICIGEILDHYQLDEIIEYYLNNFSGQPNTKRNFRSLLKIEKPIPDTNGFIIKIDIFERVNSSKKSIKTVKMIVFKRIPSFLCFSIKNKKSFFSRIKCIFGCVDISFLYDCITIFLYIIRNECHMEIIQETTNQSNDPLFPFKCNEKGNYVLGDFINLTFNNDYATIEDIGQAKIDIEELEMPLDSIEEEVIDLPK